MQTIRRKWLKWTLTALCVLWVLVIWCFSLQTREQSGEISDAMREKTVTQLEERVAKEEEKIQPAPVTPKPAEEGGEQQQQEEPTPVPDEKAVKRVEKMRERVEKIAAFLELYIRKMAHFLEYFILGGLACLALYAHGFHFGALWALPIPVIVGAIDETIQHFVPGRVGSVRDVLLDSGGGAAGVAAGVVFLMICMLIVNARRKRKAKKLEKVPKTA